MHSIIFTGHMIDAPGRKTPRFPAALEPKVKAAIYHVLYAKTKHIGDPLRGLAAAACGSDIIFHECCIELNIASEIFLAKPAAAFNKSSVAFAGNTWIERYEYLLKQLPVHILPGNFGEMDDSVWEQANSWMLQQALKGGGELMTLIAVWDGKAGDGKGGTQHMINIAKQHNAEVNIIDIDSL